jgi:hypothetical protein
MPGDVKQHGCNSRMFEVRLKVKRYLAAWERKEAS